MLLFALSRWPGLMPPNFSAAYAIAFCAGVFFPQKMAWWLPMGALLASDLLINIFAYDEAPIGWYMIPNYLGFIAIIFLGRQFSKRSSWVSLLPGGILSALLFYVITNTAAWLQLPYPKTLLGWIQALTTGLPGYPPTWTFLRNTLLSGGLFTGLFVLSMKLSETGKEAESKEESEEPEAESSESEEAKA
jgi:hypothetical protein